MIIIDGDSPVPPSEQVRSQLVGLIRSGELSGGRRLPSIRQLAGDLRIAPGTVVRAYNALEAAGLVEMSRTAGTRVCDGQIVDQELRGAAERLIVDVKRRGAADLPDVLAAVRAAWERSAPQV